MLPVKKIYVDSKYKTADSKSDANFKFQLPQTCYMPDNTKFFISDVAIPHTWYTINDFNCKLYLRTIVVDSNNPLDGLRFDHIITLNRGTYNGTTFKSELQTKIQGATGNLPTMNFDPTTNQLSLYIGTFQFQFLTDHELQDPETLTAGNFAWNGDAYDKSNLQSANNIISNTTDYSTPYEGATHPMHKQLNLQPIRNVYIHSPNLGNFNTLGPRGESTIIKKVPVNNNYSEMIFSDYNAGEMDALDCSKQTLRQLEFRLTNVDGIEIPFNGNHVSFSIVFN